MLNQALAFVVDALFSIFIMTALLRFWMQAFRAPVRNPIAQFTMALTDWAVKPLRRVIPGLLNLDWASLIVAWAFEFLLQFLLLLIAGGSPIDNPTVLSILLFISLVKMVRLSIYIFMGAIILQAVLSWVQNAHHPVAPFFDALTRPFLKPLQRAIPPIGGMDITPVFALIALQLVLMLPVTWLEVESTRMAARALL